MGVEAQIALCHTQTCDFVLHAKATNTVLKVLHANAHPKLCRASLTSKRCDRRNCYYYHVAGTLRPLTEARPTQYKNELVTPLKHVKSQPTPLMQVYVTLPSNTLPSTFMQNFIPEHSVSNLPPETHVSVPLGPPNHLPSNEPSIFLERLKELTTQMSQLQQMHSYLIQNLIDHEWPPLAKT